MEIKNNKNNNKKTYDLSDFDQYCSDFHAKIDTIDYFLNYPNDFEIKILSLFGKKYFQIISDNYEIFNEIYFEDFTEKEIEIILEVYKNRG